MKKCGIYKITSPSNKIYIGQSQDIHRRWKYYYQNKNCKKQSYLYNSLQKHGVEVHIFEIVEECSFDLLNEKERYWQEYYDCINPEKGLNLRLVNTKDKKYEFPQHIKDKIKLKKAGYKLTEKHKEILRIANTGRIISEDTRKKISEKNKGKKRPNMHSDKTKQKLSILKKGRKLSEKTKLKMSLSHMGRKCATNKKIFCIEDNLFFESITLCAKHYNISHTPIWLNANRKQEKVKSINKTFKYA